MKGKRDEETICRRCPRGCNRASGVGFCGVDIEHPEVAAVVAHHGEEPVLAGSKGICNIFFAHCNLCCIFCQNHEISRHTVAQQVVRYRGMDEIVAAIERCIAETENMVGFVSPTQYSSLIPEIVEKLHGEGFYPTVVYNSNGYERVEVLQQLAPYVDIYLPDFKYIDDTIAKRYSGAEDYPEVVQAALREMYNQKGAALPTDDNEMAFRGIIIRHLILPGEIENSIGCLRWIAENLSTDIHISLMAQYNPPAALTLPSSLRRPITAEEYGKVVEAFQTLGFHRGWIQELNATECYNPHFYREKIFS